MKKLTAAATAGLLLLAASAITPSCISIPDDIDAENFEEKISEVQSRAIEKIQDTLDQPLVVVSQTGDTVVSYLPDSVAEGTAVRKITVRVDEREDIRPYLVDKQRQTLMALSAIVIPCATVLLIAFAILIFIFVRNRNRNAIISQAIEKGYELPESFYSGQNTTRVIYQNAPASSTSDDNNSTTQPGQPNKTDGTSFNLPPIPPTPPVNDKNLQSGIKLAVVGLCILIFFLIVDATSVAILAGGIPLLLGLGRIGSWYYLNQRN